MKGSLPRLRFGRAYWIRARAVDLAGNSLEPQATDFGGEEPSVHARRYLRYEPVAAPIVALLSAAGSIEKPAEGESMLRMAIRSFNDTPADNTTPTAQMAHRVAAPPQVSVRDAEQHSMLDWDGKVDATLFNLLAHQKDLMPTNPSAAIRDVQLSMQGPLDATPVPTTYAVYESGRALDIFAGSAGLRSGGTGVRSPQHREHGDHSDSPLPSRSVAGGAAVLSRGVR